jgi:hypothetical protein
MNMMLHVAIAVMLHIVCMELHRHGMFGWKQLLLTIINVARLGLCHKHRVVRSCIISPFALEREAVSDLADPLETQILLE